MPPRTTDTPTATVAEQAAARLQERQKARQAAAARKPNGQTLEDRLLAAFLGERYHAVGCPGFQDPITSRVEAYGAVRPASDTAPATNVVVVRCMDCGGHRHEDGVKGQDELVDRLLAEAAGTPTGAGAGLDEAL